MGAWGIGIFSNDTAADVREDFRGLVAAGVSAADAAARLHEEYGVGGDADYDADFWLGLAAAQHRLGHVDGEVLRRAIDIIDSEAELERWPRADRARRRAVLQKLRTTLGAQAPAPKKIRPRTRYETSLNIGEHVVVPLGGVGEVLLRVVEIHEDKGGRCPVAHAVQWDGADSSLREADGLPPMREPNTQRHGATSRRAIEGEARGFILTGRAPTGLRVLERAVGPRTPTMRWASRWVVPWTSLADWFVNSARPSSPWHNGAD